MRVTLQKLSSAKPKALINTSRAGFTIYSNQHQRASEMVGNTLVRYDPNIVEYEPAAKALLEKRWTTKEELRRFVVVLCTYDDF